MVVGGKGRGATLADVARAANVSPSTASRALNDSPLIPDATKAIVREAARKQNYRVNTTARNLRRQTSSTVALVLPADPESGQMVSDPFFLDILGAVADALQEKKYDLLLSTTGAHPDRWFEDFIMSRRADGLIVIGQAHHADALEQLAGEGAPVVVWGAAATGLPYCSVGSDNLAGGDIATSHLLALGRRHIAFLGDTDLPEVALRYEGYRRALAAQGLSADPALLSRTPFTREGGAAAINRLADSGTRFDAVFATSDLLAMSAIQSLQARGIGVPQDVSVVGYDDIQMAAHYSPALTTISQNIALGGTLLVNKLMDLMAGQPAGTDVLEPRLIIRQSCGSPVMSGGTAPAGDRA
ncbi:LacI family DNA-binding transcriptional regulator [Sphingobium sp. AN641]|uniref:LacI family DNA-binding transcriptional regulator n=1 Tax=Sphingobium sp. AN641 TaxID=3133443 RepID=UPI0030BB37E0